MSAAPARGRNGVGALPSWEQLEPVVPQIVEVMRRYLTQIGCVLRPGSVTNADIALRSFAGWWRDGVLIERRAGGADHRRKWVEFLTGASVAHSVYCIRKQHFAMQKPEAMTTSPRNNSSSVRRALGILRVIASWNEGRGATLSDLAEQVGASKSTILRLLVPLLETNLVQQLRDGSYAVGVGAVSLGSAFLNNLDLRTVAQPALAELAAESGETVHLMVYSGAQVVYVDKISGPSPIQMASRVGDRAAVHSTASGKAILAHMSTEEFERVVAAGLPRHTARTLVTADQLAEDLVNIRARGYSVDDIENEDGIRCVASPVFDHTNTVVAAVSLSGPAERVGDRMDDLADLICSAATQISEQLGARSTTADSPSTPSPSPS